jgi:N-acetylmuramoyl-L-alanine amidase
MARAISTIKKIIVHCSGSDFGDRALIDVWHRQRGWTGCGYHYVICNGKADHFLPYDPALDGKIQTARPLDAIGAHCRGHNSDSVGICLIGRGLFTPNQLYRTLPFLLAKLLKTLNVDEDAIFGHRDFDANKTCPNIETMMLRRAVFLKTDGAD